MDKDWDLREHLKPAIEELRADIVSLGHRVEMLETGHDDLLQSVLQ